MKIPLAGNAAGKSTLRPASAWVGNAAAKDAFSRRGSGRPKSPLTPGTARSPKRFAGTQFDPAAVEAFIAEERVLREMVAVKCAAVWSAVP